jgi:hypothetical protein
VALHLPDTATADELAQARRALEAQQGRTVRGWRRHGPSAQASYPGIWRSLVQAGLAWSSSFAVQSQVGLALSEGTATGCRLPFWVVDAERGETLPLLELPSLDTQDVERLTNLRYGARLSQWQFESHARSRLDLIQKNNLDGGYLLRDWAAGVTVELGRGYGATGCRELLVRAIEWSKERELALVTHEQVYDWWRSRSQCRVEVRARSVELRAPAMAYRPVLELLQPLGREEPLALHVEGAAGEPTVWGERADRRYLLPASPGDEPLRVRLP